jgi:hypothetical protein
MKNLKEWRLSLTNIITGEIEYFCIIATGAIEALRILYVNGSTEPDDKKLWNLEQLLAIGDEIKEGPLEETEYIVTIFSERNGVTPRTQEDYPAIYSIIPFTGELLQIAEYKEGILQYFS